MPIDGMFVHYLTNELKDHIIDKKIYKVTCVNDTDFVLSLSNKENLLISLNLQSAHLRITKQDYLPSSNHLKEFLLKHLQGGIIKDINQYNNDRIVIIDYIHFDELSYEKKYRLYIELLGRASNLIICDSNDVIIEALRKTYLSDKRLIKVGAPYEIIKDEKQNPFLSDNTYDFTSLQGLSKYAQNEIRDYSLFHLLKKEINPCIVKTLNSYVFYYCKLDSLDGTYSFFDSISEMLEYYFTTLVKQTNESQDLLNTKRYLEREIDKLSHKLEKQKIELEEAKDYKLIEEKANLLLSNINQIKPYMSEIVLNNYFENNKEIKIAINPNISPSDNVNAYFNKVKKSKRAIGILNAQIENTLRDIAYYEENLSFLSFSKSADLKEIMYELGLKKNQNPKAKPKINRYQDNDGNIYIYGKNNTQNEYVTFSLAKKDEYWFHVKSYPGSHVILRGELNDKTIKIASSIASIYSKVSKGVNVAIDYTLVKWVKKIKGEKGSQVTYTHEKTVYANPLEFKIEEILKAIN